MKRENIIIILSTLALAATGVAIYLAFIHYKYISNQPKVGLFLYQTEGDQEVYYESLLKFVTMSTEQPIDIKVELPLKVINESNVKVERMTLWVRIDNPAFEISANQYGWQVEKYANKDWIVTEFDELGPHSGFKVKNLLLTCNAFPADIKIEWELFPSNAMGSKGELTLRLVGFRTNAP